MRGLKQTLIDWAKSDSSRIFYRCVDWNLKRLLHLTEVPGRIFYRCVDWNFHTCDTYLPGSSRIFYRCVDWNFCGWIGNTAYSSRIFYRCVDWNLMLTETKLSVRVSHLLQMRGLKPNRNLYYKNYLRRIFYRCVDWNSFCITRPNLELSRIFYRCVDWNCLHNSASSQGIVASFTDAWIETIVTNTNNKPVCRIFYRCVDWNDW